MSNFRASLEAIAEWFNSLGTPEPIVHWGHPIMMGIVVFVMGGAVALAGWRGRTLAVTDTEAAIKNKTNHRKIAPLMYVFLVAGYTGGVLSLVMQGQPILESPHFLTGTVVVALLTVNAVIAATGFIGNKETLRTVHAYVGSLALVILVVHAVLGLKLGLSI
jgi:fucose 4-O-acetylase-like acetyltransferase